MQTITATFEDGVLKPAQPLDLPPHAEVRVTIELLPASPLTVGQLNTFLQSLPALGDDADGLMVDTNVFIRDLLCGGLRPAGRGAARVSASEGVNQEHDRESLLALLRGARFRVAEPNQQGRCGVG
jgi:predicted DNA-binding antitoxin AbrB/MazE fold protein